MLHLETPISSKNLPDSRELPDNRFHSLFRLQVLPADKVSRFEKKASLHMETSIQIRGSRNNREGLDLGSKGCSVRTMRLVIRSRC